MTGLEIAVIGMAGRFPGAKNTDEFWNNLKNGVDSITFFSDAELEAAGIEPGLIKNPDYVKANGLLADIEYFDPSFFNYSRREAEVMDPQMRLLHECTWEALENSGYDPETYKGLIGLYGGASSGFYWESLMSLSGKNQIFGFGAVQFTRKDMACFGVSYRLNLQGPVFSLYTACSTSLVAIHLASQGLLSGECDMALAGGVTISMPMVNGYVYREGMILSQDGHCRSFDTGATGTIGGNGAAFVVLKRLEDALADKDYVYAIIKGSAINNDGNRKVGFTAPSIKGQVEVIRAAHKMAEVEPESIGYVETHGTGTALGDPIEIKALTQAFNTGKKRLCGIGSVKSNVGHMDAAAGAAGFIKAVLALKHRLIPPSLHINKPNPELEIENSPFYVVSELTPWENNKYPLRAAVSSFGVGGTNAHVVLEEWPGEPAKVSLPSPPPGYRLILLSAKTESALQRMTQNLAAYLREKQTVNFADVAYTLQVGRKAFGHRRMAVCSSTDEAIKLLESTKDSPTRTPLAIQTSFTKLDTRPGVFMFPGQGAQYADMGLDLYQTEPVFRQEMDRCFEIANGLLDYDLKGILYPGEPGNRSYRSNESFISDINQTEITQPVLFIFEYALARLLMEWGIKPGVMIGHSIGEYVAACLSGVYSLENALKIVALRGKLMQQMPTGAMLGVSLPVEKLMPPLALNKEISLAAVNSPSHCALSGPHEAVMALAAQLKEMGIESQTLHTSHAFHSKMMDPILKAFEYNLKQIELNKPKIPFISNLTGEIITEKEAVDPRYWTTQLRQTVEFSRGINRLLKEENFVFLEVGPGRTLSTFVKKHKYGDKKEEPLSVCMVRHPKESVPDTFFLMSKIGQLWLYGVKIDGETFYAHQERHRVTLPAYSFDRIRCWPGADFIKPGKITLPGQEQLFEVKEMTEWFYVPTWERTPLTCTQTKPPDQSCWLVFVDASGFGERLVEALKKQGNDVISVYIGEEFAEIDSSRYNINPRQASHYDELFHRLARPDKTPGAIIHLWGITPNPPEDLDGKSIENALDKGFNSLIHIARAITEELIQGPIRIGVVTDNLQEVTGDEALCPGKATVLAPVKIIPLEYPNIFCRNIDIVLPPTASQQENIFMENLVQEFTDTSPELFIAYRGKHRWTQSFKRVHLDKPSETNSEARPAVKEGSVCLVSGESGDALTATAEYLLKRGKMKLILILPPGEPTAENRQKLQQWEESLESFMVIDADVSDEKILTKALEKAKKRFERVDTRIHVTDYARGTGKIQEISSSRSSAFVVGKVKPILVLDKVLKDMNMEPDFVCFFSSIGTVVYPSQVGNVIQCAANEFLDAFSYYKISRGNTLTSTINNWLNPQEIKLEWLDILNRIRENKLPRLLVSPLDLKNIILHYDEYEAFVHPQSPDEDNGDQATASETISLQRQGLTAQYEAPGTETEKILAGIWKTFFGVDKPGIDDDFFELGGDSLQAMTITTTIHQTLQVKIPLDFFFSNSTIRELADYIDNRSQKEIQVYWEPVEKKQYYPLSPMQKTIWYIYLMNPDNLTYNISFAIEVSLNINKHLLAEAFGELLNVQESLRTSFETIEEKTFQRVKDIKDINFTVEYYESTGNHEESLREIAKNFVRPFDLGKVPLLRVGLIKIIDSKDTKYIMTLDMHHIVSDGTSGNIIIKSLKALAQGEKLPRLKIQYKDYTAWYNLQMESGLIKKQEKYWLKRFEKVPPLLNVPTDYERPMQRSQESDFLYFEIEPEKLDRLKALAQGENVTFMMLFMCIYYILLSKLTGQEDIVIAAPLNGRNHNHLEQIVGMFAKTLYFRNYPRREKNFAEFLKDVRTTTLEAYENQDYPPDTLTNLVNVNRQPGRNPITDLGFSLVQIEEIKEDAQPSSPLSRVASFNVGRNDMMGADLTLVVTQRGNRIFFRLAYLTKLFKRETINRFAEYYKNIIDTVIENKNIPLKHIRLSYDLLEAQPNITNVDFDL